MTEKDPLRTAILGLLFFDQDLNALLEELNQPKPIVTDVLKHLIADEQVVVLFLDPALEAWTKTRIYDGDNLQHYRFMITAKGIKSIE